MSENVSVVHDSNGHTWLVNETDPEKAEDLVMGEYAPDLQPEMAWYEGELSEFLDGLDEYNSVRLTN